jgi:tetratricopeptide (TPR) repeat protein
MDKISFIIPNNNTTNKPKGNIDLSKSIGNETKENVIDNTVNKIVNSKNITDYVKLAPNVYRFGKTNCNIEDDIYVLYSNSCQVKTENKYTAIEMFRKCYALINDNTKTEIKYEICVNLALLITETNGPSNDILNYYDEALKICPDRCEPYYYCSIYCNKIRNFEKAYDLLKKAILISYNDANAKYPGTQLTAYGKYLYDELSVTCYWLKKYDESKLLLETIIDDPDFNESRERIKKNLDLTKKEIENLK